MGDPAVRKPSFFDGRSPAIYFVQLGGLLTVGSTIICQWKSPTMTHIETMILISWQLCHAELWTTKSPLNTKVVSSRPWSSSWELLSSAEQLVQLVQRAVQLAGVGQGEEWWTPMVYHQRFFVANMNFNRDFKKIKWLMLHDYQG